MSDEVAAESLDQPLGDELARHLISSQFPELARS